MTITELKKKLSEKNIKTGAKKATAILSLAAVLATNPTIVKASVPAENIIGDAEYDQDRTEIKENDYKEINNYFKSSKNVSLEDVEKAIELSDAYNSYFFDLVDFTNTTKEEVLSLDIDSLYDEYTDSILNDETEEYCQDNLTIKPAVDAYITFSCGSVSRQIKLNVASKVQNILSDIYGSEAISLKSITINEENAYVIAEINNIVTVIELDGATLAEIKEIITPLDNTYNISLKNIGGYSEKYEDTFAYNGVDKVSKESAWLSFPDESKKENLQKGIELAKNISLAEELSFSIDEITTTAELTETEEKELSKIGYSDYEIATAAKTTVSIEKVEVKTLEMIN